MIRSFNLQYQAPSDLANIPESFLSHPSERILIQIFSGVLDESHIESLLAQLLVRFPDAHILGTSTAGEIMAGRPLDGAIVINFCCFEHATLKSAIVRQNDDLQRAGIQLGQEIRQPDIEALIVFGCGLKSSRMLYAVPLLESLHMLFPRAILAGGQAGDNSEGKRTLVFTRDGMTDQGAVAVSIAGKNVLAQSTYNLSWAPIGKTFTVTKVEGSRVFELDGQKPYDIYCRYLGKEVVESPPLSTAEFPLMTERDGLLIAIIVAGQHDDGSFDFNHHFKPGEKVRFGFCHAGLLASGTEALCHKLRDCASQVAFIYSCVSRKWVMGEDIKIELSPIEELAPSCGFFGYGEYYGLKDHPPLLLNSTMTTLSLAECDGIPASPQNSEKNAAPLKLKSRRFQTMRALHHLIDTSFKESVALNRELAKLARKDSLTGLANRYLFDERLSVEIKRHGRSRGVLSLIMLDVDHFKLYNDTYGHVSGDECLRKIAGVLTSVAQRSVDLVARYGGEEFVIILPETRHENALQLAQEIRMRIEKLCIPHFASKTSHVVTVSQGVVSTKLNAIDMPLDLMLDLLSAADQQLYLAKTSGRNQIRGINCQPVWQPAEQQRLV